MTTRITVTLFHRAALCIISLLFVLHELLSICSVLFFFFLHLPRLETNDFDLLQDSRVVAFLDRINNVQRGPL